MTDQKQESTPTEPNIPIDTTSVPSAVEATPPPQVSPPAWKAFLVPASIIIAGIFIGAGIIISSVLAPRSGTVLGSGTADTNDDAKMQLAAKSVAPVSASDHIRGSRDARVVLVEFSDMQCPYCLQYHPILQQLSANYNPNDFAWVYRHFPLTAIHDQAQKRAEASECVAELAGESGFWRFIDSLFDQPASTESQLSGLATQSGVADTAAFTKCLNEDRFAGLVTEQLKNGITSGVTGTPHSILIHNGEYVAIRGSASYDVVKSKIDELLKK